MGDCDTLVAVCDAGMNFLDYRILNFPSRLLSYMYSKFPVLAWVEESADIGDIIEQAGFGWKSYSDNPKEIEAYQIVKYYKIDEDGVPVIMINRILSIVGWFYIILKTDRHRVFLKMSRLIILEQGTAFALQGV